MSAPYRFDRYRNGRLMAEGIKVNKENCLEDAIKVAVRLADRGDVLVYDVALDAMLAKAREDALREAASIAVDHRPERPLQSRATADAIHRAIRALIPTAEGEA